MRHKEVSRKFNHAVGEVVGTVLQFFGALYFIIALMVGVSVLLMGMQRVFVEWYHEYGFTFEGIFWIATASIGILCLVVDYSRALWKGFQEWAVTGKRYKNQPDDD